MKTTTILYELQGRAITGRNRTAKFFMVDLSRVKPDESIPEATLRDMAQKALASLKARNGRFKVFRVELEESKFSMGDGETVTTEMRDLLNGPPLFEGDC